jgi:signal transduction histidine kinase
MHDTEPTTAEPLRKRAFEAYLRSLFLTRVRVAAGMAVVLVLVGLELNPARPQERAGTFLLIWLLVAAGCLGLFGLTWLPALARWPRLLGLGLALGLGLGIEGTVLLTGGFGSPLGQAMSVLLVGAAMMLPWDAPWMAGVAAMLLGLHLLPALLVPGAQPGVAAWSSFYFLLNTAAVAVAGALLGTRLRRREFSAREELEARTRELREASGNLRATVGRLRELDRQKSQLFANVSHELRTPLTVTRAVLEELGEQPDLPPEVARRLGLLRTSAQTLLWRINDLLELSAAEAGRAEVRREPVDVGALVEAAAEEVRPFAGRCGVRLEVERHGAPVLSADVEKLETVLRNLLSNAVKFTPAGGQVTVRCREVEASVELEVEDTGVGVRPEDRERIFERFTRVTDSQVPGVRGSGIGLALVRELVRLHGGEVVVAAGSRGHGALFRVRLPRVAGTEGAPGEARRQRKALVAAGLSGWDEEPAPTSRAAAPSAQRLLVAEDHPDLRRFLVEYLGAHYHVEEAPDGQAALERVRERAPDLVVADVMMPRLSGRALAQALKADPATADVPVLLLTAQRGTEAAVRGLQEGAVDFIPKPFSPRELLARIRAQLRVRELSRELASAQRMAMLGTLTAGLAHEVRNPINAIVNALPLVRDGVLGRGRAEVAGELVGVVDEAARRIQRIVDDLLGFTRRGAEPPGDWSPDEGVRSTLKLLQHHAPGARVRCELVYGDTVKGHPDRLNQVLTNLLDNALRAAGPGGTVRVRTGPARQGVEVTVQDDGPGIAPEVLPRIFDPFFTTRDVGQGTGLGLHLSRQIVEAHGGTLGVDSRPGHGATFTLWLPSDGRTERHS